MVKKYKPYLSSVLLACAVGALSGFLSRNGMQEFQTSVLKPPLTPPPILFPIVWTILYVLMGLGAALVAQSPSGAIPAHSPADLCPSARGKFLLEHPVL